mgnify:CR=1 FL=1
MEKKIEKKIEKVVELLENQKETTATEEAMEKGGRWKQFTKKHKGKIIGGILIATGIGVTAFVVKKFINSPVNASDILEQAAEATESVADIIATQV